MNKHKLDILDSIEIYKQQKRLNIEEKVAALPVAWQQSIEKAKREILNADMPATGSNVIAIDFSCPAAMSSPLKLAADSSDGAKSWVDSTELVFVDTDGQDETCLNLQISSGSSSIRIDMYPSSSVMCEHLKPHAGGVLTYSLVNGETMLATVTGVVEADGDFLTAEGELHQAYLPTGGEAQIDLYFHLPAPE